ncbi:response regulator [Psychroserpens sp.]
MNLKYALLILLMPLFCSGQSQNKNNLLKDHISTFREFYGEGQLDSAYHYVKKSYDLAKELKADSLQIEIVSSLSGLEPDLEKALSYLEESEPIAIKNKQWSRLKKIYYARGAIYYNRTDDSNALVHFLRLDSLLEARNSDKFLAAMTKVSIINILYESRTVNDTSFFPQINKNIDDGLKIVEDASKVSFDSLNFYNAYYLNVPAAILYEKKGYIYDQRNEPQKAIEYYQKALNNTVFTDTLFEDNHLRKSIIYNGLGNLYNKRNQQDSALHYYKKELVFINKTKDTLEKAITNYKIAEFYNNNKDPRTALNHLKISQDLMQSAYFIREEHKYNIQDILASVHFNLGNFEKAFLASERARNQLIAIQSGFNKENVSELETKYQTEKKEQEIKLLTYQKELANKQKRTERIFLLGGIIITGLLALFLFLLYENRKKTTTKLRELDAKKSRFFANISHEFRTPLTLISNPIDEAIGDTSLSHQKRKQFKIAKRNSDRLLELVNQLLDLSKIDAGELKLQIQDGKLLQFIAVLADSFSFSAKQKDIQYIVNGRTSDLDYFFDKDAIEKIITNLIANAIKYTPKNEEIIVNFKVDSDRLILEIKNSGSTLAQEEVTNLFERFYQTSEDNTGSGIGLALVKELITLHKGSIDVKNSQNGWLCFSVMLPVDENTFESGNFIETKTNEEYAVSNILSHSDDIEGDEDLLLQNNLPILLIVEDNADIRNLLKQEFIDHYTIVSASNGEEGIDVALETIPDIIISDIMMPVKDGIALTQQLKTDERTSHIPIILLTAKAGDNNELLGVEVGADDYITKPFNSKILKTKVKKLIESRRLLQERYSQELVLLPTDVTITNIDEQFLKRLQDVLDADLVEPSFSASSFSVAIGMSRMQLHRKLKALTGLTTSEFIRSQRLKLAAKLLKESDTNISQIGYSVGFNDHTYFSKCFKEFYNCTPSEYTKK